MHVISSGWKTRKKST